MKQLVLATQNQGKAREVQGALPDVKVLTLADFPEVKLPPESGNTFEANARIKAEAAAKQLGIPVLADDSGLVVDALDGAPGVHSARYCEGTDKDRYLKLLQELKEVPEPRAARFACAMVFASPEGGSVDEEGFCEGVIALEPRGEGGFGYDPVFWLPQLDRTMAELSVEEKNGLSHRGSALRKILPRIKAHFSLE